MKQMPGTELEEEGAEWRSFAWCGALSSGNYEKARPLLESAVKEDPMSATGYYYLGLTAFATDDYEHAVASLKRSVSLEPGKTDAQLYIGMAYYHQGQYDHCRKCRCR